MDVPADNQAYKRFGNLLLEDDEATPSTESYLWAAPVAALAVGAAVYKYAKSGKKNPLKDQFVIEQEI
jgi:cytochrome c-type biogenesis protein CcmH/NrfF